MALPQVRTILHSDRRHRHAGRLVPLHSANPGCFDLTDVHGEKAWCSDHIHDWGAVSFHFKRAKDLVAKVNLSSILVPRLHLL